MHRRSGARWRWAGLSRLGLVPWALLCSAVSAGTEVKGGGGGEEGGRAWHPALYVGGSVAVG